LQKGWGYTLLTNLLIDHPIPPLKVNTFPSLGLRLNNVKQKKRLILLECGSSERMSQ